MAPTTTMRVCPICDGEFRAVTCKKYCSKACVAANRRANWDLAPMRLCVRPGCGKYFQPVKAQRFCSIECRRASRRCCSCREPITDLPGLKNRYCRDCDARFARERRLVTKTKATELERYRKRHFGLSPWEYRAMYVAQNGLCAICGRPETSLRRGRQKMLAVDHDHETGKIRGLLCNRCNSAIGLLRDDPFIIADAMRYVSRNLTPEQRQAIMDDPKAEGWA